MSIANRTTDETLTARPLGGAMARPARARRGAAALAFVLLVVGLAAALSVDVAPTVMGIKGDEATYVGMTLSLAHDYDLAYERRDLERFWAIYREGPSGIFLKRGKDLHLRFGGSPPFVHVDKTVDARNDRLFFGKAFVYPLVAAPFVRAFGLNGFLVLHVLLLFGVCGCGYLFLAARSRSAPALVFALAFVGAAAVPVYAAFLTSDLFNFAVVFFAYFLWLYKEDVHAAHAAGGDATPPRGLLAGPASDVAAALLLAAATYSKPTHALLIAPLVLLALWRRRWTHAAVVAAVFVVATGAWFGANALVTGELNYQGGDRKTFYGHYPFESPTATWDNPSFGTPKVTNDSDATNVLAPAELANRFGHNVEYFLVGRDFGLVPYFFPAVVAIGLWLASAERRRRSKVLTFGTVLASAVVLLLFAPYTWSGGGGPPGNRYFLSLVPPLFFLTPPLDAMWPGLLAWIGGALFTAKMLVNPFATAKFTYTIAEAGPARALPVELTMANDLPIALDQSRAHVWYGQNPPVLLYFLDRHAYPPDPGGIWVASDGRADIIVRADQRIDRLRMTASSPVATVFTVSAGDGRRVATLGPGQPLTFDLPARGVRDVTGYAYLLSAESSNGFVPRLLDPTSGDGRDLGVLMQFQAVLAPAAAGAGR